MSEQLVVVLVVLFAVALVGGLVVAFRPRGDVRRGGVDLEPPPTPVAPPVDDTHSAPVDTPVDVVDVPVEVTEPPVEVTEPPVEVTEPEPAVKPRFRDRIARARSAMAGYLGSVLSRQSIDQETWDELEEALIRADIGAARASEILDGLRDRVKTEGITEPPALLAVLEEELIARLQVDDRSLHRNDGQTSVWLFVGVNGVGKTTTVGKLGAREHAEGRQTVMVAGDTFRAAAAEQLQTWAERCGAHFVRGAEGADPSSVIFDGIEAGAARSADVVLCDTAGRLHNKSNLMDELRKVRRVADKAPGEVTEVLLVIDATTGQNGLEQARVFTEAVEVSGVVLTKLDGSAKGGIVLAIQADLGIPVKLVGLGESADDLIDFDPDEFVRALLATD